MFVSNQIYLVAEDELGLAFGRKLLAEQGNLTIWREENGRGFGNLKRDCPKYDNMARSGLPVLMLTDLDARKCCAALFDGWLGKKRRPSRSFLLRVCVREAEAWLMAHAEPLATLLQLRKEQIPQKPENLSDPKATLFKLASKAPSKIRKGLLPAPGSSAHIGPEYNDLLCPLVKDSWDIEIAGLHSPSLQRARMRVRELATRVTR